MDMRGEVFGRCEQPAETILIHPRCGFSGSIARGDNLVPSPLVVGADGSFDLRILDHEEPPTLHVAAARGADAGFQDLPDQLWRDRVRFQPTHRTGRANDLEE